MKKNQQETKKEARKGKEPLLDLNNEIKIITSSNKTFALWKDLIIKYSQGELLDLEVSSIEKINLNQKLTLHKDGIMNKEFFKWLGNCDEEDHRKLILHLLSGSGEKRIFGYPKVTIKQTSKVLEDCFSAKEWLEHWKRKRIIRQKLKKLKPNLRLFNAAGVLQPKKWKKLTVTTTSRASAWIFSLRLQEKSIFPLPNK